ncbi:fluoride efflux transporter CrcB [Halarchaeum sp. P4]|uniref:fluoride efflux transporter CrcB n=1 Tax=Halarchaeum sp. P4 TaxID=3421639 RepID=UPI003EBE3B13
MSAGVATATLVGLGGALGALARTAVGESVDAAAFPLSTFVVNVAGSFLLALLTFAGVEGDAALLLGTGVCGAFTTFSSFAVETVQLWEDGDPVRAALNAAGNLVGAGVAIGVAWLVVRLL